MKNEMLTRAYAVAAFLAVVGLLVFGQTFRIAVQEGDRWRAKGDSLHITYRPIEAPRGNILAVDGSLLATSQPFFDVRFDTRANGLTDALWEAQVDSLAYLISTQINPRRTPDSTRAWLDAARANNERYVLIKRRADYPLHKRMGQWPIFRLGQNRGGFISERSEKRRRPFGMMAQRTIGYTKKGTVGVGLEGKFQDVLGGEAGRRPMMRLPGGHYHPVADLKHAAPRSGSDIQTTLDVTIQDIVQQEIYRTVQQHQADYGVGIVMETATGAIRAMTSLTNTGEGTAAESYNLAVGTRVEPGSTFKLASMLALLDDEKATLEDTVRVFKGVYDFYDVTMRDASPHGLDTTTLRRAFELSSNVGMARLVERGYANDAAGRKAFVDKLRQFRLDRTTGVEILGEALPQIKDPSNDTLQSWSGITLPWMSMGYEVELTPLQLTAFYNAVANDGRYMKPHLVSNVQREGRIEEEFAPLAVARSIASPEAIRAAQELLEGVVERGTAKDLRSSLYSFAGKTGTVQYKYSPASKRRGESGHQASFIGYFPAENPRYTMLVLVSKPQNGSYYGSAVALPAWRRIADKLYASDPDLRDPVFAKADVQWDSNSLPRSARGSHRDIKAVFASLDVPAFDRAQGGMIKLSSPGDTLSVVPLNVPAGRLPDVRGMGARDAMFLLEDLGCRVELKGRGKVKRQSIKPGTKANGQYVRLTLG